MRRRLGWIGLLLTGALGLASTVPSAAKPAAPPPAPGWLVDRARFESLTPDGFLSASDLGDYRGAIEVVRSGGGVGVINDVGVEDYVRGIAEVPSSWPAEALRAQAIAARTYALHEKANPPPSASGIGADICPTQDCQVYVGLAKERADAGDRWVAAVESTKGQVILRKGAPIRAMYYAGAVPGTGPPAPQKPAARPAAKPPPAAPPTTTPPAAPQPASAPLLGILPTSPPPPPPPPPSPAPAGPAAAPSRPPTPSGPKVPDGPVIRGHGIGMSQYGALAKAQRGAGASSILASYYGGARPGRLPSDRMPASIRVALDTGRSAVTVSGPGRFRLLDQTGQALAVVATGDWKVLPGPQGKLRVVPPPGQELAPGIEALGLHPEPVAPGGPPLLRVRLSAPALVQVALRSPTGAVAAPSPPQLLEAGESVVALPTPAEPGAHAIDLTAYSGLHRVVTTSVDGAALPLSALTGTPTTSRRATGGSTVPIVPAAIAFLLLLAVTAGLLVTVFTPPSPEFAQPEPH